MKSGDELILMDQARVDRSLKRMAHQIREQNREDSPIIIIGIDERGYVIAQRLGTFLSALSKNDVDVRQIMVKNESEHQEDLKISEETFLLVVDDVIFSGRTMFRALKRITGQAAVRELHTAVLVDRGHRSFPIKAEFCGMELPTKLDEHVAVIVEDGVVKHVQLHKQFRET